MAVKLSDHFTYRRLLRFVLPSVAMMLVTSIYSIVDGFFVSNFAGKNAFAALNLVFPVLMALAAFGFMIGTGGSALVSFTLGEGKRERANEIFSMLTELLVVVGVLLTVVGYALMPQIAAWLGASALIFDDCVSYGRILLLSLPFFLLQNSFQSFLVTAEKSHVGLMVTLATGLLNMALDYLLVAVFHGGIIGAALATAVSQALGGIVPLVYFLRKNKSLLRLRLTAPRLKPIASACANGSSEMLTNLSSSLVGMLYNLQLMKYAAENGIAAYGVVMYVSFIFNAIFFGYAIAVGPLIGYQYGAGNRAELKNLLRKSLLLTLIISLLMTAAGALLAEPISRLFVGYDAELLTLTVQAMLLYAFSYLFCGFNIFASAFFTGLNNGLISAVISILRTLVIQVAAIFLLPLWLGMDGIWLAIVAAEGITLLVAGALLLGSRKRYGYGTGKLRGKG